MSLLSIDDWKDFMYNVGEDFYDLVHGEEDLAVIPSFYCQYKGLGSFRNSSLSQSNGNYFRFFTCDVTVSKGIKDCLSNMQWIKSNNNYEPFQWYVDALQISSLNSFVDYPIKVSQNGQISRQFANGNWTNLGWEYETAFYRGSGMPYATGSGTMGLTLNSNIATMVDNGDGSYSVSNVTCLNYGSNDTALTTLPSMVMEYPCIITDITNPVYNTWNTYITNNNYSLDTYNYTTDNGDTINVYVSPETGFVVPDFSVPLTFDDLLDIFNTIICPVINVANDFPSDTLFPPIDTFQPPVVTGDININIDLPDVTGEYPSETITPIESDVYNIMSIDSMPELPSLTGIDNGESAVALGTSFTFLDGCGLLMPFVTIAIIRLLISKFRGDS